MILLLAIIFFFGFAAMLGFVWWLIQIGFWLLAAVGIMMVIGDILDGN